MIKILILVRPDEDDFMSSPQESLTISRDPRLNISFWKQIKIIGKDISVIYDRKQIGRFEAWAE